MEMIDFRGHIGAAVSGRLFKYLLAAMFIAAPVAQAQTAPPPANLDPDRRPQKVTVILDQDSKELADEYLDVLQELQDVVSDYSEYLAQANDKILTAYKKQFEEFSRNLDKGVYSSDHKQLNEDLTRNIDQLEKLETEIRESEKVYPLRLYRLVKSLRRQLVSVQDLLSQDVSHRLAEVGRQLANINVYVSEALAGLQVHSELTPDGKTIYYFVGNKDSAMAKLRRRMVALADSMKVPPAPPDIPDLGVTGHRVVTSPVPPMPNLGAGSEGGEVGLAKQLSGSVKVSSDKVPITISNKLGSLRLTGSDEDRIRATLDVEVAASTRQKEKDYVQQTVLNVTASPEGYRVEAILPEVPSHDVRILKSALSVSVPAHNPVVCKSSFGEITIEGLSNYLRLTAAYSPVTVSDIRGDVFVASSMGELKLSDCVGRIKAENQYSPITITDCNGDMDIQNSYSEVSVSGSKGTMRVKNSGVVKVSEHTGNIWIDNTYGEVEVSDLDGNLDAVNAYSPLTIKNVKGKVSVKNANSRIDVDQIQGGLTVDNKFGQVFAQSLAGPLLLNNVNGNVNVVLDGALRGKSSISTSYGNINLTLPQNLDLYLKARTVYGSIKSFLPISLIDDGMSRAGTLTLGRGLDSLSLVGSNGSIIINEGN